jgi:hypothetical protein
MIGAVQDQLIADVSRELVARAAPQELPLFRAVSSAYFEDPNRALTGKAGKEDMLGFGVEAAAVFLTPVALAVTTQVVTFLSEEIKKSAATESADLIGELVKRLFKKFRPTAPDTKPTPPPLTPQQLGQVRQLAIEKARQLNLPDAQAQLLADSLAGSLAIAT